MFRDGVVSGDRRDQREGAGHDGHSGQPPVPGRRRPMLRDGPASALAQRSWPRSWGAWWNATRFTSRPATKASRRRWRKKPGRASPRTESLFDYGNLMDRNIDDQWFE